MLKSKIIYLIVVFLAVLAIGGLALAQQGQPPADQDSGDQGPPPPENYYDNDYYRPWAGNHSGRDWRGHWADQGDYGPGYGHRGSQGGPGYGHRGSQGGPGYGHRGSRGGPGYGHRGRGHDGPAYGRHYARNSRPWAGPNAQPNPRSALTKEQLASLEKLHDDHQAKVEPILDQIRDNKLLYRALANQQNAPVDEIKKTISELSRLRKELRSERSAFNKSLKDQGFPEYGPGHFGPGHPGPRMGHGPGGWSGCSIDG